MNALESLGQACLVAVVNHFPDDLGGETLSPGILDRRVSFFSYGYPAATYMPAQNGYFMFLRGYESINDFSGNLYHSVSRESLRAWDKVGRTTGATGNSNLDHGRE